MLKDTCLEKEVSFFCAKEVDEVKNTNTTKYEIIFFISIVLNIIEPYFQVHNTKHQRSKRARWILRASRKYFSENNLSFPGSNHVRHLFQARVCLQVLPKQQMV